MLYGLYGYYQYPSSLRGYNPEWLVASRETREKDDKKQKSGREGRMERIEEPHQTGTSIDNEGWISIDGVVRHGQTVNSPYTGWSVHFRSLPTINNTPLNILDSRSVGMISSVYLSVCRGVRVHVSAYTCTRIHGENEGALQRRIWLRFAAMKLVICCTSYADVPFIARGATMLFQLFLAGLID